MFYNFYFLIVFTCSICIHLIFFRKLNLTLCIYLFLVDMVGWIAIPSLIMKAVDLNHFLNYKVSLQRYSLDANLCLLRRLISYLCLSYAIYIVTNNW